MDTSIVEGSGWLTVPEAAQRLKVDKQFIYDACASRGLRHARLGRLIRIREHELERWTESHAA